MEIERQIAHMPKSCAVAGSAVRRPQGCIGCTHCKGLCAELIEALTLPDVILKQRRVQ